MQEFVDFLGAQSPFDKLDGDDLRRLAGLTKVEYFPRGAVVVTGDGPLLDHMWVVRSGELDVVDRGRVVDVLGTGDSFGHISMLSGLRPALTVRASTDALCYQLPDPRTVLERPDNLQFTHFGALITRERLTRSGVLAAGQSLVRRHMRPLVWAEPDDTIGQAAQRITDAGASYVLSRAGGRLAIATDRDFRAEVASGRLTPADPIRALVVSPVATVSHTRTVADALIRMVEVGVHHLVVVDDDREPVGVVRTIDLGSVDVRDPLIIRSAVEAAASLDDLARAACLVAPTLIELHDNDVPAAHIGTLLTAVVESLLRRLLELHGVGSDTAGPAVSDGSRHGATSRHGDVETSWLVLGSLARREPLPASDVDTALIWSTPPGWPDPAVRLRTDARAVLHEMTRCELRPCPDGANADNPLFSRSRSDWVGSARRWIQNPTAEGALLLSSIIADSRPITNVSLGRTITDAIRATARGLPFLDLLLRYTLQAKPPVGFVRDFVVEHGGRHHGGLDLKRGGLTPIVSLARWSAIALGDVRGGTPERLRRAADAGLLTVGEHDELGRAFEGIYALLLEREINALRTGSAASTWIYPRELDGLARRHLRESFRAVSSVQTTVANRWQTRLTSTR